ncbi:glycosyltransferase family 29 protein [Neptunicoccus sediminis]|uniref:glycosyltransferase family 29 protein n=1 Tax=Neptunicoccus sediminis TaxID=1892596 RepID=UPI000B03C8AF|nr:glycosyltransferase family 29 protein [Neptunicoccus sediminis]
MISQIAFALKRIFSGEKFLAQYSCSINDLQAELAGKTVAIVGNARSLSNQSNGENIDRCDLVIRMHAAPLPQADSHGSRTNWLALGMPVAQDVIEARNPDRLLWMAKKRKRLRARFAKRKGFYLHPKEEWDRMAATLQAPPTTGIMLIDLVAHSEAAEIHLFGFDFFTSLSLSGRRTAAQVPHDFAAEKLFTGTLIAQDQRVVHHTD